MPSERSIGSASTYTPPKKSQSGYDRAQQNRVNSAQSGIVNQQSGYDRAQQNRAANAQAAAKAALIARQTDQPQLNRIASAQVAPAAPAYTPTESFSGSGRSRGFSSGGGGGGVASSFTAPVSSVAPAIQAPPATVVPPPSVTADPGGGNVAGASFDTIGQGQGTYGQEMRRRQARGPMTGMSITPEMLKRAASQRLG